MFVNSLFVGPSTKCQASVRPWMLRHRGAPVTPWRLNDEECRGDGDASRRHLRLAPIRAAHFDAEVFSALGRLVRGGATVPFTASGAAAMRAAIWRPRARRAGWGHTLR